MNRKFGRRLMGILLVTMVFTGVFTGCGPAGQTEVGDGAETEDKVEETSDSGEKVKLNFWRAGTGVEEEEYWLGFIERFEADNPNIEVELSSLPWGDDIETKLNAAYASDTAPDVLNYAIVSIPQRAGVGQYMSLEDYVNDWDGKDDMYESILELGKYQGEVYGLGIRPDPRMFVWRKDMFEEAGLDPDTPPADWDELKDFAEKLTIKDGNSTKQAGLSLKIANGFQDFQIFLTQNGGDFIDAENNEPLFDSPEAIETLEYLKEFVDEGYTVPEDGFQTGTDAFENGVAAMAYKNPADINAMLSQNPDLEDKIGMSGPLGNKERSTFSGLGLQFISEGTKHKDEAWEFVKASMSPEEMKIRYEDVAFPIVRKSLEEEFIAENPVMNEAILDAISVGRGAYMVTYSTRLNDAVSDAIEQAYYGQKTPEEALKESAEDFRNEIPNLIK